MSVASYNKINNEFFKNGNEHELLISCPISKEDILYPPFMGCVLISEQLLLSLKFDVFKCEKIKALGLENYFPISMGNHIDNVYPLDPFFKTEHTSD